MITIDNINGAPKSIPNLKFGCHSDDDYFYFFESKEEHDNFLNNLPTVEKAEKVEKVDISNIDIDTLSQESIDKLKKRLGVK